MGWVGLALHKNLSHVKLGIAGLARICRSGKVWLNSVKLVWVGIKFGLGSNFGFRGISLVPMF